MDHASQKGLNADQIKLIAILAMTVDHLAWVLFPGTNPSWYAFVLHAIGRLTAPIMWYFVAEGSFHTRNIKRYAGRMFLFAILSHFAFCYAFGIPMLPLSTGVFNQTSVMWSLAWAVMLIAIFRQENVPDWAKILSILPICLITFPADWSSIAVMCPFFLHQHRGDFRKQMFHLALWVLVYAVVYFIFLDRLYGILQLFTLMTIPILARYNGQKGSWKGMKWFFYLYYPAHMVLIGVMRLLLHGDIPLIF